MKLKEIGYLIGYSLKSLLDDLFEVLSALKRAKTWSFILYATFFLAVYYRNLTIMKIALPLILVLYIIRQHKEPEYNRALKDMAFLKKDEEKIRFYYERYKKQCYFGRKDPLSYEDYKQSELKSLKEKKHTEQGPNDTP